ncbi:MAG: 4-hydroxy-3-methylbut-2-enyl diphosphate reductase [Bacteroidales bacterium]|nr:4-hydroxy-3-methylbut-2-enyl diphosphate reductase [Bacteroidales bacterium]
MMQITIDKNSGFCFGVVRAIEVAEKNLKKDNQLYCLGDIVHNNEEVKRIADMGLQIITHEEFAGLRDTKVLIRAHGEPPETYAIAKKNNIQLIDATCVVVLKLQNDIKKSFEDNRFKDGQILIFGKTGHAEVVGLLGQTTNKGIVISSLEDIDKIDYTKPAKLYSQTTQSVEEYEVIIRAIQERYAQKGNAHIFRFYDTICRRVANRAKEIEKFASLFDKIIFVSGEKSSNGLYLFDVCKKVNPNSYFIYRQEQLESIHFNESDTIGICGATSTPMWLMKNIADRIKAQNGASL